MILFRRAPETRAINIEKDETHRADFKNPFGDAFHFGALRLKFRFSLFHFSAAVGYFCSIIHGIEKKAISGKSSSNFFIANYVSMWYSK